MKTSQMSRFVGFSGMRIGDTCPKPIEFPSTLKSRITFYFLGGLSGNIDKNGWKCGFVRQSFLIKRKNRLSNPLDMSKIMNQALDIFLQLCNFKLVKKTDKLSSLKSVVVSQTQNV